MLDTPDFSLRPPPPEEYEHLLQVLGVPDSEVVWAVRVGSRVYGTAHEGSDRDYMVALRGAKDDLVKTGGIDIVVKTVETFQQAIADHNIFALECYHTPMEHTLKRLAAVIGRWTLHGPTLQLAAREKSDSDYNKAVRGPMDYGNKKRLWHSLRVVEFAGQLWTYGYIKEFEAANEMYFDIMTDPSEDPAYYVARWSAVREQLLRRIR